MSDRRLDPATGDFVAASRGAFESCDDIENQIAFSYCIEVGSWEGDPELGHRFAELDGATNTTQNQNRLRDLAAAAVQWLIDLGRLTKVEVRVESYKPDAAAFQVDYYTPGSNSPRKAGPFLVALGAG